jgi:diguanylate cyclase (GGDEF)-like protein
MGIWQRSCIKRINDTYGHNAGDDVLKVVAATLKQRLRDTDFAFRIGGDEFAVLSRTPARRRPLSWLWKFRAESPRQGSGRVRASLR